MSKKTNDAKRKAALRYLPGRKKAKARRPNPAVGKALPVSTGGLVGDPIFMHHVIHALFRYMELRGVEVMEPAEFIEPEGVTGTVNPDTPEDENSE